MSDIIKNNKDFKIKDLADSPHRIQIFFGDRDGQDLTPDAIYCFDAESGKRFIDQLIKVTGYEEMRFADCLAREDVAAKKNNALMEQLKEANWAAQQAKIAASGPRSR